MSNELMNPNYSCTEIYDYGAIAQADAQARAAEAQAYALIAQAGAQVASAAFDFASDTVKIAGDVCKSIVDASVSIAEISKEMYFFSKQCDMFIADLEMKLKKYEISSDIVRQTIDAQNKRLDKILEAALMIDTDDPNRLESKLKLLDILNQATDKLSSMLIQLL